MIEILLHALGEWKMGRVFIVVILLQNRNIRFRERFNNPARNGGLPCSGATADSDDQRFADEEFSCRPDSILNFYSECTRESHVAHFAVN